MKKTVFTIALAVATMPFMFAAQNTPAKPEAKPAAQAAPSASATNTTDANKPKKHVKKSHVKKGAPATPAANPTPGTSK